MNNKIKVITPFYNPGKFLLKNVRTLVNQKYDNYEVIYVDDCSTDGSVNLIPQNDDRVTYIRNEVRKTALENLHNTIMNHCDPDDIVVIVDGDDWLPSRTVLSEVNDLYNETDCWVSYGQASWTDGRRGFARAYTFPEFQNMRKSAFVVSHLRTFRAGLYQKIQEQDPNFSCMKDSQGEFYKMTYDVAIMFPIMEMAGFDKVRFVDKIWYIYNRDNVISDDKVDQSLQHRIHAEINQKQPFQRITEFA